MTALTALPATARAAASCCRPPPSAPTSRRSPCYRKLQVQRAVLEAEQPDFVVLSGDMASGWVCAHMEPACPPGWYEARWRQLIAPVQAAGIPYAIILGNHE